MLTLTHHVLFYCGFLWTFLVICSFGKDVKVVQFRGASKPWEHHYDYQNSRVSSSPTSQERYNQQALIQEWWNRYNKLQQNVVRDGTATQNITQDFLVFQTSFSATLCFRNISGSHFIYVSVSIFASLCFL